MCAAIIIKLILRMLMKEEKSLIFFRDVHPGVYDNMVTFA
jgi:hypothetical protein